MIEKGWKFRKWCALVEARNRTVLTTVDNLHEGRGLAALSLGALGAVSARAARRVTARYRRVSDGGGAASATVAREANAAVFAANESIG